MKLITPSIRFRARSLRGDAALELAFLASLMLLLLLATVEFGRVFYLSQTVADAARAGVEYGAQSLVKAADTNGMQQTAINDAKNVSGVTATAKNYCKCSNGTTVTCGDGFCATGPQLVYVEVDTSATFTTLTNFPGIPSNFPVKATAIRQVE
jgi:Flp pilus assembly protein TadG